MLLGGNCQAQGALFMQKLAVVLRYGESLGHLTLPGVQRLEVRFGGVIRGIDKGIRGMTIWGSREIRCKPADTYGEHYPHGVQTVEVSNLPATSSGCPRGRG